MKGIKNLPQEMQIKIFHKIIEMHGKDTSASQFGSEVSKYLNSMNDTFK